jgi:hypothetical protein
MHIANLRLSSGDAGNQDFAAESGHPRRTRARGNPFKANLTPDCERLVRHCQWLLSQNCGLAVFGTNSEANSMAADERSTLLDALVAAGIDPSRMMPGVGKK